jgi:hypothetical protein
MLTAMAGDMPNRNAMREPQDLDQTAQRLQEMTERTGLDDVGGVGPATPEEDTTAQQLIDMTRRVDERRGREETTDNNDESEGQPISRQEARAALPNVRARIRTLESRLEILPREHSGRFNQQEAQILGGYVSEVRRKIDDPNNVLGGNKFIRRQVDQLDSSQFRTPDAAKGFMLDIGRKGVTLERAQQRFELRVSQYQAISQLKSDLEFANMRRKVNSSIEGLTPETPRLEDQIHNGRSRAEWQIVLDGERNRLEELVGKGQFTQQEVDTYIQIREMQMNSLALTDENGNARARDQITNPYQMEAFVRLNEENRETLDKINGALGENELVLNKQEIDALRSIYSEIQGDGARRVTNSTANRYISNLLDRSVQIAENQNESFFSLPTDDDTLDSGLAELSNTSSYIIREIRTAKDSVNEAISAFDQLSGEIDLTANPNAREDIQRELSELRELEERYTAIAEGREPVDINENTEEEQTTEVEPDPSVERKKKILRIIAGAVAGGGAVLLGAPAGAIMAVAAGAKLAGFISSKVTNWRANKLSDSTSNASIKFKGKMAEQGLSEEEIEEKLQSRVNKWRKASEIARKSMDFSFGVLIGAGITGFVQGNFMGGNEGMANSNAATSDNFDAGVGRGGKEMLNNTTRGQLDLSQLTESRWAPTNTNYIPSPTGGLPEISSGFSGGQHGMLVNQFLQEASKHGITNINQLGPNPNAAFDRIMSNMLNGMNFEDAWMAVFNTMP